MQPPHEPNHERWLVSYADYVTLLFAVFVVMFASSHADHQKAEQVSVSVRKAYASGMLGRQAPAKAVSLPPALSAAPTPAPRDETKSPLAARMMAELQRSLETLSSELEKEIQSGKIRVRMETRGLVISLQESALFAPGADTILPEIKPSLDRIAEAIRKLPNPVRLEGHTDSTPIHTARFRNNWELSVARAVTTLDYLTLKAMLPIRRFAVAGYGDSIPAADNSTPDGRARNRRVDVVILNEYSVLQEPRSATAPSLD